PACNDESTTAANPFPHRKQSRSAETVLPRATSESAPRPVGHASVAARPQHESSTRHRPTAHVPNVPAVPQTTGSSPWTPSPPAQARTAADKTARLLPRHAQASVLPSPRRRLQPTNLLPTRVIIASYNQHRRLLPTDSFGPPTEAYRLRERSLRSYPINTAVPSSQATTEKAWGILRDGLKEESAEKRAKA